MLEPVRSVFRAVAESVVPDLRAAGPEHWRQMGEEIEHALATRPSAVRRQLVSFLRVLDWWSLPRYGRRLTKLDAAKRTALLESLERHPL
ncbi:MAG: hypothetical protein ACREOG_20765, partial [Gemmatimonadaceae bacterium]